MKTPKISRWFLFAMMAFLAAPTFLQAQGTAFTYQGRLDNGGAPASGTYDLAFSLFPTNSGGSALAGPVTNTAVAVSNGLFTTTVDFGNAFTGASTWLQIAVSVTGSNTFTTLSPRQQLTPVPYALIAANVSGTIPLSQLPASVLTNGATGAALSGTFTGNGGGLTNLNYLSLARDFGAVGGRNNLETAKLQAALNAGVPVRIDVSVTVTNCVATNGSYLIGDGLHFIKMDTSASGDCIYVPNGVGNVTFRELVVAGQGGGFNGVSQSQAWTYSATGSALLQAVTGTPRNGIHCGVSGTALLNCNVGGFSGAAYLIDGYGNTFPQPTGPNDVVLGCVAGNSWQGFAATNSAEYFTFSDCQCELCGMAYYIGAGNIQIVGGICTKNGVAVYVDGNVSNPAHGIVSGLTMNHNEVSVMCNSFTNGEVFSGCMVLGQGTYGGNNSIYLTNCAGVSFDGGYYNSNLGLTNFGGTNRLNGITTLGYFPIANFNGGVILQNNIFNVSGPTVYTNSGAYAFTGSVALSSPTALSLTISNNLNVGGNVGIGNTNATNLLVVGSSGSPAYCSGTTWVNGSDRNIKEAFAAIDPLVILQKVSTLPISEWKYKVEADGARHLGPVAQDFHAAFGLNGPDDTHIATVDESGVALAAIQGLDQKLEAKSRDLETENARLKAKNDSLERRLARLEQLLDQKHEDAP